MKRVFLIVLLPILLCGCTCEYNLKINDNGYEEKLNIISNDNSEEEIFPSDLIINTDYDKYIISSEIMEKKENEEYYDVNRNGNTVTLSHNHTNNSIQSSTLILKCFDKATIYRQNNSVYITTSPMFKCFDEYDELDSVKVVLEIDGKSIQNNADKVEGNKYIWNYTKNSINKSINIVASINEKNDLPSSSSTKKVQDTKNDYYIFIIVLFILFIIALIIYSIMKKYGENNNKI